MRLRDREKALELRKDGKSYSQIKKALSISKSTLSYWLRDYPLSKEKIRELVYNNERRIERYRETMREKHNERLKKFYDMEKKKLLPLNKRDIFIAGLFLYWGEGNKQGKGILSISNTDPYIINFFIYWLVKSLKIPREKIKIQLQLYSDMNIEKEMNYWSEVTNIPLNQFTKSYVKESSSIRINHKGSFGHGTCNARIGDVLLAERTLMGIKIISDKYKKGT